MERFFSFLEHLHNITSLSVRVYSRDGAVLLFGSGCEADSVFPLHKGFIQGTLEYWEKDKLLYGGTKTAEGLVVVLGPSNSMQVLSSALEIVQYACPPSTKAPESIKTRSAAVERDEVTDYFLQCVESGHVQPPYSVDLLYLDQIRDGDVDGIRMESLPPCYDPENNVYMQAVFTKWVEYMACSATALATRAAIDGGVDPATAYAISDLYLQRLLKCQTVTDITDMRMSMRLTFAEQVQRAKETRSKQSYVDKAKIYISHHLNKPFTLDELAVALALNKSYLCRKFKEETGMSIMQFVREQRVDAAASMLKHTDEDVIAIANHLCFQSQSHFTAVFKQLKGITPQKFRNQAKVLQ
ncbi:MAG: AraC family transcriptional regulator [Clostridiales bacterium]|nr:AraC family transcriptional regulator [Clostridiales bacterium]